MQKDDLTLREAYKLRYEYYKKKSLDGMINIINIDCIT